MIEPLLKGRLNEKDALKIRVFADPNRIAILMSLQEKPKYISELIKETDIPRSTLVYHLSLFEKIGIVQSEYGIVKAGSIVVGKQYSMNKPKLKETLKVLKKIVDDLI